MKSMDGLQPRNRLADTGSPYLEQHAHNPVHWHPWGPDAFKEAKERNLPILVSIGYSTCHWCHVMARECFEDASTADVMNSVQVNVKVDREQHPGVDAVYMEAAQALNGSGGWPLNVFIDHDGRPFLVVTYLPKERWVGLIREINRLWRDEETRIADAAAALASHLEKQNFGEASSVRVAPEKLLETSRSHFDSKNPGFAMGNSPMKFPPSQTIDWLLEHGGDEGREMALDILTAMMDSGLHDRIGGGFHRYSVDERWRVPHFEKMTYDNAQLMGVYARAALLTGPGMLGNDLLAAAVSTADWFLREMRITDDNGVFRGYATAVDADDPLGEGSYYAWPPSELFSVLGENDARWIAQRWNISGDGGLPDAGSADPAHPHSGEFEPVASWIPHPRGAGGYPESYRPAESSESGRRDAEREAKIASRLLAARRNRPSPVRDDKILTDQNALVLEGLSRLARYGGGDTYRRAALELADLMVDRFGLAETAGSVGPAAGIYRTDGIEAYITDYGYLAMALTGVYGLSGNPLYVVAAEKAAREAVGRLATGDGAYYGTPIPADESGFDDLFKRSVEDFDGASPAGQHALGIAFARLYTITGNSEWKAKVDALLEARGPTAQAAPSGTASLIRLASIRENPDTLVVAGPSDHPKTHALLAETRRTAG
ncbi:MAG: DUF255 domain-containing protein, partial [Spirochaetaceae bacterium]|nr:DUF255 domain-containing protein [Spirochaetaceae bacterium]